MAQVRLGKGRWEDDGCTGCFVAFGWALVASIVAISLGIAIASIICSPALAHMAPSGWVYPPGCCRDHMDCQDMPKGVVTVMSDGVHINLPPGLHRHSPTGMSIIRDYSDGTIKPSGDNTFHLCISSPTVHYPEGIYRCTYVPEGGV